MNEIEVTPSNAPTAANIIPESTLFPLPPVQEAFEAAVRDKFGELLQFIAEALHEYHVPATLCAYCGEVLDFDSMMCPNNHFVETCTRTSLPITDLSASVKCYFCSLSCLSLNAPALQESDSQHLRFQWIFDDARCPLSGHNLQRSKYAASHSH
jgi:hypothetical protein